MQLDDIIHATADHERGAELELRDPVTGEGTDIRLWIAGPDSDIARRARLALSDELADMVDVNGRVTAADRERARLNALAALVLRWQVSEDGKPVPFSTSNVLRLLRVLWVQEQVDAFAGDRRNFAPGV